MTRKRGCCARILTSLGDLVKLIRNQIVWLTIVTVAWLFVTLTLFY